MSRVDLHTHSTASDGKLSPAELVARAAGLGLKVVALTDHDTVDGIAPALEAAAGFPELQLIPGIEISTDVPEGEVHMLGYFIDYNSPELLAALERFRSSRKRRAEGMVAKLRDMGIDITWERVKEIAGQGSIGRPHIAEAMLEKGYIDSFAAAFNGYIEHGGPAYVERDKMTPAESVRLVASSGGLPVLAHPYTIPDPAAMVAGLVKAGLAGIEAYYKDYTPEEVGSLVALAGSYGLICTGGSDYHGLDEGEETGLGGAAVPMEAAEALLAAAGERAARPGH